MLKCTFVLLLCHLPACCLRWRFTCPELKGDTNVRVYESFNIKLLLRVFVLIYFIYYVINLFSVYICLFTLKTLHSPSVRKKITVFSH